MTRRTATGSYHGMRLFGGFFALVILGFMALIAFLVWSYPIHTLTLLAVAFLSYVIGYVLDQLGMIGP